MNLKTIEISCFPSYFSPLTVTPIVMLTCSDHHPGVCHAVIFPFPQGYNSGIGIIRKSCNFSLIYLCKCGLKGIFFFSVLQIPFLLWVKL